MGSDLEDLSPPGASGLVTSGAAEPRDWETFILRAFSVYYIVTNIGFTYDWL